MSQPFYGRNQVAEPLGNLALVHTATDAQAAALKEVDHETPVPVLDQSDLLAQGIHCTRFIPGCRKDPDALGSCTAETFIENAGGLLSETELIALCNRLINHPASEGPHSLSDTAQSRAGCQRGAISFYHVCTDQTGDPASEWPPTDCGSSGIYIVDLAKRLGVCSSQVIASSPTSIVSLLQAGMAMMGSPWFYSWEEPDSSGFIDGQGRASDLEAALASGVAGGHETSLVAVEKLTLLGTGRVDPYNTVLRGRNHWTKPWGDNGCYRVHLSTLAFLAGQIDIRRMVK